MLILNNKKYKMGLKKEKNWKINYTWVLIANAIYIMIFYLIMKLYS
jgi:hypothetical protein